LTNQYASGSGWPSFTKPVNNDTALNSYPDTNCHLCGRRTVIECKKCGIRLGYVFDDVPGNPHPRYSVDSVCLHLVLIDPSPKPDLWKIWGMWWIDVSMAAGIAAGIMIASALVCQFKTWFSSLLARSFSYMRATGSQPDNKLSDNVID